MESFTLNVNASGPHLNENEGAQITSKPSVPTKALPAYTEPMQLTIHIPDETAALLQSRGVEITKLIEQTVAREAHAASLHPAPEAVAKAVDRILDRRSRLSLNGLKIRDLIDEGRKY